MIKFGTNDDLDLINSYLAKFNQKAIVNIEDNPYNKFLMYFDDECCGFMQYSVIYNRIELDYIYVNENHRHEGIASNLVLFLIDLMNNNNFKNISLEVSKENIAAINLYKKYGFKEVAIRKQYYNGVDGLLLVKEGVVNE